MKNNHIVLAFPNKNATRIKKIFSQNDSTFWLYLGQNFLKRRVIEREFGKGFKRINITRLHDEVANELRHEYVHWIDDLNRLYGTNLEWWFGSISSRNVYSSNLFQYCCYLEILDELWEDSNRRPELVVIESIGLARAIQKWAAEKNIIVDLAHYNRVKLKSSINQLSHFVGWGNFITVVLLRWMAAFITRKKHKPKQLKVAPTIIVDTFLHDYCLSDEGVFKDRYFPYLHEYLFEKGYRVLVHPVLVGFHYNYYFIYKKIRRSDTHFILKEDFLHFSDYLSALIYPIKVLRQKIEAVPFRNFDLSDILKEEQSSQSVTSGMEAILIYRLFLRLGIFKLQPEQIINWYENQVIDKALIAGARKAFAQVKIIGAQMFIHSPNFISLFPSQSEAEANMVPHLLVETSCHQCQIAQSFTNTIPCQSAAALRYEHLFNNDEISDNKLEKKPLTILVLLPFSISEAVELLETLKDGLEQIRNDIVILIKGHPDFTSKKLTQIFGEEDWPNRFEIYHDSLPKALKLASVVISSNSSSIVEAASRGIPVIFLGRQTALNHNMLSSLDTDIITECFYTSELVEAIEKYIYLSPYEKIRYKRMGKKVRDLFFEPVNEKTLSHFFAAKEGG